MKEISIEKMRYSVPGVRNRFFAVHVRFILLCALLCALAVIIAVSYITIRAVYRLEPKASFFFFCEVDDVNKVSSSLSKYDDTFNIFLVRYDDTLAGTEGNAYNFINLDEEMTDYDNPKPQLLLVFRNGGGKVEYTYEKLGLDTGAVMDAAALEKAIRMVRESI